MKRIPSILVALMLAGAAAPTITACASMPSAPVVDHQTAQRAMVDCDALYAAIATIANQVAASAPDKAAFANQIKRQAWDALQAARKLYAANQAPGTEILKALLTQAQALNGGSK